MIQIPETKYKGLPNEHFNNIKPYLEDSINFFINCCDILFKKLNPANYKRNLQVYKHDSTIKSWLASISTEPYKEINIIKVLAQHKLRLDFLDNIRQIYILLKSLINPLSPIHIKNIIISTPEKLEELYQYILRKNQQIIDPNNKPIILRKKIRDSVLKRMFVRIFNYDKFSESEFQNLNGNRWSAYEFCNKLNINVCPYCNRLYTFTVLNNYNDYEGDNEIEITRPDLDHFFPQSRIPVFALSFFNLIPSCTLCNSRFKSSNYLHVKHSLHPYLNQVSKHYKFNFKPLDYGAFNGEKDKVKLFIEQNANSDYRSDKSLKQFRINEIYRKHNDVVSELIYKRMIYSDSFLDEISELLTSSNTRITKEILFHTIFNPPNSEGIIDISLGKLRNDIIDKLKTV
jgi:hypothetical protein